MQWCCSPMWMLYDGPPQLPRAPSSNGSVALDDLEVHRAGWAVASAAASVATSGERHHHRNIRVSRWFSPGHRWSDKLSRGRTLGTLFEPALRPLSARYLWLAHATTGEVASCWTTVRLSRSRIGGSPLLPAGIVRVEERVRGGPAGRSCRSVWQCHRSRLVGLRLGRPPAMLGRSTRELAAEMGPAFEREVVHVDDLVVLGANPQKA